MILIELLAPPALLLALALPRAPGILHFALTGLAVGLALFCLWLVMPWHLTSMHLRGAYPLLYVLAVWFGLRRVGRRPKPPPVAWRVTSLGAKALAMVSLGFLTLPVIKGHVPPDGALRLAPPLRGGRFVVGHGGATWPINAHARVPPQDFALDILGVNSWGMRATRLGLPRDLEDYVIFGAAVVAPCDGRVVRTVDGLADQAPGRMDQDNLAGNHVLLDCEGIEVLLAHLRQGSVRVAVGQEIATGDPLGSVGNSGNTTEPHLHLHAERGGVPGDLLDGEGVPLLIDRRFLVRGDRFGGNGDA